MILYPKMDKEGKKEKGPSVVQAVTEIKEIDWEALGDLNPTSWTPEEMSVDPDPFIQPKWDIPKKVGIQCAIAGGGAWLHAANPNQPRDLDRMRESAEAAIEAGPPTVIHFDHDMRALHTRDGEKMEPGDSYMYVVKPLLEKYGREKVLPHINCMRGSFKQQMLPMVTELAEVTYFHGFFPPGYCKVALPLLKKHKVRPEIVIHNNTEIETNNRVYIKPGHFPNPNLWIVLHGACPRHAPPFTALFEYYPDQHRMARRLAETITDIKEIDPGAYITFCCSGRASTYLVTLAMLMGCHIRMGMEDTVWQYPHSDEMIKDNAETIRWSFQMARLLGREPMTPNEYRETVLGRPARFDHAETLKEFK